MKKLLGTIAVAVVMFCLSAPASSAQPVSIWVGFSPGGGFDLSARLFAKHFPKHLPGNPDVIVRNKPGAGGIKVLSWMYKQPQTRGFDIVLFHPAAFQTLIYGKRKLRFKPDGFRFVGNMYTDVQSCVVWRGAGQNIKTFDDLRTAKQPVLFGSPRPSSMLSQFPAFFKNALGANLRVIQGYHGTRKIVQAMARGELQASCGLYTSTLKGAYKHYADDLNPFIQFDIGKKSSFFGPETTPLSSLTKTKEQRETAKFIFGMDKITRPFLASSGLPKENIKILRKAFMDTMRDPALRRDFKKMLGITPDPLDGAALEKFFKSLLETPRQVVNKAWKLTRP